MNADRPPARLAGGFKAKHRISYADGFAAALAKTRKVELVAGDREFEPVANKIRIAWR